MSEESEGEDDKEVDYMSNDDEGQDVSSNVPVSLVAIGLYFS